MKKKVKVVKKKAPYSLVRYVGKSVFIRTVTHHYTGHVEAIANGFIWLNSAAWIADDGRFSQCIGEGKVNEVEPYPAELVVAVAIGSIIDVCAWSHSLPRAQK